MKARVTYTEIHTRSRGCEEGGADLCDDRNMKTLASGVRDNELAALLGGKAGILAEGRYQLFTQLSPRIKSDVE